MMKKYNKLVRDKIPQIIKEDGKEIEISKIQDADIFKSMLADKLKEEVDEYLCSFDPEELADILEVIHALTYQVHSLTAEDIEEMRIKKAAERGSFKEGIILKKVY